MIQISVDTRFVEEAGGGIILDIKNDRFFDLNATGAMIWRLTTSGHSIDDIAEVVAVGTDVELSVARNEVSDFLATLATLDLISITPPSEHHDGQVQ